jgi:hypothetical protein
MAGLVTHLDPGQPLDPTTVLAGPWHSIETTALDAGQELRLDNERSESAVFVEHGNLSLVLSHATVLMGAGDAVTLVKGASGTITAGPAGARLFITRLKAES